MAGIELPRAAAAHPAESSGTADFSQDHLAAWVTDLTTLHELIARLTSTAGLDGALYEVVRAGAALAGARRGYLVLQPPDGRGPDTCTGFGLGRAELGAIETVPRQSSSPGRLLDGDATGASPSTPAPTPAAPLAAAQPPTPASIQPPAPAPLPSEICHPDLARESGLDPRHQEVARRLGAAASYAVPLEMGHPLLERSRELGETSGGGRIGALVWLYDEPAQPTDRQRHLIALYARHAADHLARRLELARATKALTAVRDGLLPARLPQVPGARLAVRHLSGPRGGGDWYDVLPLPDGALGLAIGSVNGAGAPAVAAMGRLRASLRAYAVMEGEDPVAVLSDLELLMRQTEPSRSATALFGYAEPGRRRLVLAGAGHCPPLITGEARTEFAETTLSAPLGMLACWEAPSVEITPAPGETLLLYTDGLLHRTGDPMERAMARLHQAAACAPAAVRRDPELLADHVLRMLIPDPEADHPEDVVLLAARLTA
ncbi:PP2C family protein-serine/threonine phosphatase [Streptomyces boninensis]|uniref:PP2C family protein-serine/threonine phosphatase n=1 Tax=Streptomyces boninensis TaxID=2039455 RepID=UPI003B20BF4A